MNQFRKFQTRAKMSASGDLIDLHTACLNRLTGAFLSDACKGVSLGDKGYDKFIDPKFEVNGQSINTDFLSTGVDEAQHYKIVGAKSVLDTDSGIIRDEGKINSQLEEVVQFQDIPSSSVGKFLSAKNNTSSPSVHEAVAVLPSKAYSEHKDIVDQFCKDKDIIAWTASLEGTEKIEKVSGKHEVPEFDELLSERGSQEGIFLHDIDSSIYPVVRNTDIQLIKFTFAKRLITYSCHEQTTQIPYSEIDEIMLNHDRPILGHLSKQERNKYWQQCMLSLQTTIGVMTESQDEINLFEWNKERFLYDNSARSRLVEEIRDGLGIGEEA